MKIHHLSTDAVLEALQSGPSGLTSPEASRRLVEFGPNAIKQLTRKPMILRFLAGFSHFFAVILWCGATIAFYADSKAPGEGMATLGYAILGVILVNGLFSFWQEYRAEQAIKMLQRLIPHEANVFRDGLLKQLPTEELVPGDVISLQDGDDVPADCRVLEGFRLRVNNATITGESEPVSKDNKTSQEEDVTHSKNILLAGTSVFAGEAKALVFRTGMRTEFGKIARLTQATEETLSPLQKEIVRLSRVIALIAISVGAAFFVVGKAIGISFWDNAVFALGIIVALVPEGLLPEVTLALATCSQRMAKRNALIRNLPSVETLGCTTVICTDKTGTLTQNRMVVKELFVNGALYALAPDFKPSSIPDTVLQSFCDIANNCHNLKQAERHGELHYLGDPMEQALVRCAGSLRDRLEAYTRVDEIPFDSDRKRLSVLTSSSEELTLFTKGALERVLPLSKYLLTRDGAIELSDDQARSIQETEEQLANKGLRVLALAFKKVQASADEEELERDLTLVGLVGLEDPPRPEVQEAVKKCRDAGIKVIMVTGDHPHTAIAIAREIKLVESANPVIVTGSDLNRMAEAELQLALDSAEIIFARTKADQKMRIVEALKRKRHVVAATGDGVNDAPALRAADIGISMGLSGTDVAREAADMILADDNFASIVNAVEEGRAVFANIRKFLAYVLSSNIAELIPCLAFVLFRIPLPLATIQILSVDLGTDVVPALALGVEAPDPAAMTRPPRSRSEGLFDFSLFLRAYLFLGVLVSLGSMSAYFFVLNRGGWHLGQVLASTDPLYMRATTACLSGIMCMQLVNSSMCRSEDRSLFSLGLLSNKFLIFGVCCQIGLMLVIDYTGFGQAVWRTAPLDTSFWLFMVPFMILLSVMEEARKLLIRRTAGEHRREASLRRSTG